MLIRIVFVIFIANGIDCLGGVCDDCCDCFKEEIMEYEEIEEDKNNTAKSLVNDNWFKAKKNNPVLKIFKKKGDNAFSSKVNGDKFSIKFDVNNNPKITDENEAVDPLNLKGEKYALFGIKTQEGGNTVYLYCSDVESSKKNNWGYGIFKDTTHVSISVIACDTTNIRDMRSMFSGCSKLTKLEFGKNFNPSKVTDMEFMFSGCNSLTKLDLQNFNTSNVTSMYKMFYECKSLENLEFGENFNTTNVTNMNSMFSNCSNLTKLDLQNFNTTKVRYMRHIFSECSSLTDLKFGDNFNITKVTNKENMFYGCSSFPENIKSKSVEEIIAYFKKNK